MAKKTKGELLAEQWQQERNEQHFDRVLRALPRPREVLEAVSAAVDQGLRIGLRLNGGISVGGLTGKIPARSSRGFIAPVFDMLTAAGFTYSHRSYWELAYPSDPTPASVYQMLRAWMPPSDFIQSLRRRQRISPAAAMHVPENVVDAALRQHAKELVEYQRIMREYDIRMGLMTPGLDTVNIRTSMGPLITRSQTPRLVEIAWILTSGWYVLRDECSFSVGMMHAVDPNIQTEVLEYHEGSQANRWRELASARVR